MGRTVRPAGWLRQNRWALVIVAVLLPATLAITFSSAWQGYFNERPSRPVDVAVGETVEYADAGWRIEGTERFDSASLVGTERDLPSGTELLLVTVAVDPHAESEPGDAAACTARLEESGNAVTRSWAAVAANPVSLDGSGPEQKSCSTTATAPYSFEAEFVVPADAGRDGTLTLGVSVLAELPRYARFALD
jgi:hypothetical protein